MTFTSVGSFITTDQKTFTWAPAAVGEVLPLIAITTSSAQPVTAVASSNATWVQCGTARSLNGQSFTAWKGVATSTSSATVTLTSAAANGNLRNFAHAFSASGGGANVAFDALFTMDASVTGATTSWPSATPGHGSGELLFGAEFNSGSATAGSTAGYTYNVDVTHGNGSAFNLSVSAATHPVWGDSDSRSVLVMLLYETGGAVSGSGSASLGSMRATGSGTVANPVTTAGSAALSSMRATGSGTVANPVTMSGSASLATMRAAGSGAVGAGNPGYPDSDLDPRVELYLGAWTDVTDAALPDGMQYASIKSGQPDGAQQPNPGTMPGAWDNPTGTFSPRNSGGPYFGQLRQNTPARVSVASPFGTRLRLEANASDRAYVDDTPALHVTGSMEVRVECRLSDWQGCVLAQRFDNTTPSWYLLLNSDGTLTFSWFDSGGAQHTATSSLPVPYTSGTFAVAARFDAAALTFGFYLADSIDGTFALLGAGFSFASGIASIRAGNAPLVVGYSFNGLAGQLLGEVTGFRLYNGVGGIVVADAGFTDVAPGAGAWTDSAGLTWNLAGGAEVTNRDYRLYGELGSIAPQATASRSAKVPVILSGRLRRLQAGSQPAADSPMRRAILSQQGILFPVLYIPMEDGQVARSFGPAAGSSLMTVTAGTVKPAADTSFEASAALPLLNGASLAATVGSYSGASGWGVYWAVKLGSVLPASGSVRLLEISVSGGAADKIDVLVYSGGAVGYTAYSGATTLFSTGPLAYPQAAGNLGWWEVNAQTSGSSVQYALAAVSPGAALGNVDNETVTGHGTAYGTVTSVTVNPDLALNDTVFGHLSVQKAVADLFSLGLPLNAWRGEFAADRFVRICQENGIACRILGSPSKTQALGPQPRGSVWQILRDTVWADQGILFEPHWACLGLGFRTRASMTGQSPAVTLSFAAADLPGDLIAADDDHGLLNDITASMPDGTQVRVVLDDGSPRSVSEPPVGAGRYVGQPPQPFNTSDAAGLASVAAFYLTTTSVDEARYRQVTADLGVPGAPAADIARLRPGDLIVITVPPVAAGAEKEPGQLYQSADIRQLATGATEVLGPGRAITWDCIPASPWD